MRQTHQVLTGISVGRTFGVSNRVGKPVVHDTHSCGIRVSEPSHLNRRRLAGKHKETVIGCMSGNIHKNINAVFPDFLSDLIMSFPFCVAPMIGKGLYLFGHSIRLVCFRVTEYFYLAFIMLSEKGLQKVGA